MALLGADIFIFIGFFIVSEAIFSIIYYWDGSALTHVFRSIRAVFGAYIVWRGAYYAIYRTEGLFWSQLAFFVIVGLCILAGYEIAIVLKTKDEG